MRSYDRYRERYKKSAESTKKEISRLEVPELKEGKKEDKEEVWDFKTSPPKPTPPKFPLFMSEAKGETNEEAFERLIRPLGRAIYGCSLCDRGKDLFKVNNCMRDPHFPPSINYREVAIIKWEPDDSDFNQLVDIENRDDFYITSVMKCAGSCEHKCPFIKLEVEALSKCWFKLVIFLDEKSAKHFGAKWKPGEFQDHISKAYCCEMGSKEWGTINKGLSNPQIRKRLLTS